MTDKYTTLADQIEASDGLFTMHGDRPQQLGIRQSTEVVAALRLAAASSAGAAYAERLAVALWEKHYKATAPEWKPLTGDLIGLLTQIDNMTSALIPEPAKAGDDVLREALEDCRTHRDAWCSAIETAAYDDEPGLPGSRSAEGCLSSLPSGESEPVVTQAYPSADPLPRWRHKKRGTTYTEIGRGTLQIAAETVLQDEDEVVIYRGDDDRYWVRPVAEFEDGRFERVEAV
jgi:hypothetical protein